MDNDFELHYLLFQITVLRITCARNEWEPIWISLVLCCTWLESLYYEGVSIKKKFMQPEI